MFNEATILGRVGKDPEVRTTQNGAKWATFSVATSETWKDRNGEKQERTEWHNIVIWNEGLLKVAEKYLSKGDLVFLKGQIETRKWKDKDGNERYSTEIVLRPFNGVLKLMPKGSGGGGQNDREDDRGCRSDDRSSSGWSSGSGRKSSYDDNLSDEIPF